MVRRVLFLSVGTIPRVLSSIGKLCYVIMPFSKLSGISDIEWTKTFSELFKPTIEEAGLGYTCQRSQIRTGDFIKDIIYNLKNARVVLADVTGYNPNVMWELGVRHALSKRTIIVSRKGVNEKPILSNMSNYGLFSYTMTDVEEINIFKKQIKECLLDIEKNPDRSDNPVFDHLREEDLVLSSMQKRIIRNKLSGLLSELSYNLALSEDMVGGKEYLHDKKLNSINRFSTAAMRDIVATNYASLQEKEDQETYIVLMRAVIRNTDWLNVALDNVAFNPNLQKKKFVEESFTFILDVMNAIRSNLIPQTNKILTSLNVNFEDSNEPVIVVAKEEHRAYFETPS
jgi:hypothetical protein